MCPLADYLSLPAIYDYINDLPPAIHGYYDYYGGKGSFLGFAVNGNGYANKDDDDKPKARQRSRSRSIRLPRPTRGRAFVLVVTVFVLTALALSAWRGSKRSTRAVPSAQSLKSDIITFYDNDLWGRSSAHTKDSFLFLSGAVTRDAAQEKCSSIGEKLLNITDRSPDMLLRYMTYLDNGTHPDLKHWIAEKTGSLCHALTHDGRLDFSDCKSNITTLCSQSARISQERDQNSSPRWRVKVESENNTYTGYRDRLGFRFQGIRYAPKPVRFEHSTVDTKPGHTNALQPGPKCIQRDPGGSEDCLFLNIFTPFLPLNISAPATRKALKPVMFWLHGGAFELGVGSDPISDGGSLASRGDVVVVSHNYRLGTLGFLTLNDSITTGNYGLGDSITALDWTRAHIRSFGGDPDRITIFGQSAGAALVRAFLQSPKAIGKYGAAIMQSNLGGYDFAEPYSQYYSHSILKRNFTDSVLRDTKCAKARSPLTCLRGIPAQKLAETSKQASYLAVDNNFLTSSRLLLNATLHTHVSSNTSLHNAPSTRKTANVPLLLGTMADDAALFLAEEDRSPRANLSTVLRHNTFNASVLAHRNFFPLPETQGMPHYRQLYAIHVRAGNDALFRCVDQATAYAGVINSVFPAVYYYEFERSYMNYGSRPSCNPPITWNAPEGDADNGYLKCHSGDLIYVFGNLAFRQWGDRDGGDVAFATGVVDAWASFAWRHDPNPRPEYLKARGYGNSSAFLDKKGIQEDWMWPQVDPKRPVKRILRREPRNVEFGEVDQCKVLGLGLDHFA